jgi:branched-chain amino acid transport system substrate-binding protein
MICSCSGPEAANEAATGTVIQAWAKYVNAHGGINGYPVDVIVKDDDLNPALSVREAKELVTEDHIVAMVGETSQVDTAWANYIEKDGVPVVGGISQEPPFLTNPDFFPSGAQDAQVIGIAALTKLAGKTRLDVLYCAESPICAQVVPVTQAAANLFGLKFSAAKILATAPSYAAPCLAARGAGVNAMWVADASPVVLRFVAACVQQGYNPQQVGEIPSATNAWLTDKDVSGMLLTGPNANPFDPSLPAVKTFQDALDKYAPGLVGSTSFAWGTILPWSGGMLFEAAAKAAHLTPSSTPADVKRGLYALRNETLDGLAPPLNFAPGTPKFVPCYFTEEVRAGRFASLSGGKPTCLRSAQAKSLTAALRS